MSHGSDDVLPVAIPDESFSIARSSNKGMSLLTNSSEPTNGQGSPFRSMLPYTTVILIIAALYVAWTLYSRRQEQVNAAQAAADRKIEAEKRISDRIFGSGEIRFSEYHVADAVVRPGQTTELCYGVVNAKSLKIDPPIEPVKPSARHCLYIKPTQTTTYTLTADDGAGHTKTLSLTVQVR